MILSGVILLVEAAILFNIEQTVAQIAAFFGIIMLGYGYFVHHRRGKDLQDPQDSKVSKLTKILTTFSHIVFALISIATAFLVFQKYLLDDLDGIMVEIDLMIAGQSEETEIPRKIMMEFVVSPVVGWICTTLFYVMTGLKRYTTTNAIMHVLFSASFLFMMAKKRPTLMDIIQTIITMIVINKILQICFAIIKHFFGSNKEPNDSNEPKPNKPSQKTLWSVVWGILLAW